MEEQFIKEVTGTASTALLHCERCLEKSHANGYRKHPELPWCIMLHCDKHPSHPPWWVCTMCTVQRKPMTNSSQIQRHNRTHHQGRMKKKPRREALEDNVPETDIFPDIQEDVTALISFNFAQDASTRFFKNEQRGLI